MDRELASVAIAVGVTAMGAGHDIFRGTLVAVGALADRIVKPRPSPYPQMPDAHR